MAIDDFYCGKDISGVRKGSNYECLQKGVGVGLRLDLKRDYVPEKRDSRKHIYCGESSTPYGKRKGNQYECFRKGISLGKKLQYNKKYEFNDYSEHERSKEKHLYCGEESTPKGKYKGTSYECFRKGIGVGRKYYKFDGNDDIISYIIGFAIFIILMVILLLSGISFLWSAIISLAVAALFMILCNYLCYDYCY